MGHAGIDRKSEPKVNAGQHHDPRAARSRSITGGYRVQIGAYRNKGTAVRGRDIFTRMAPELLDRLETVVKAGKSGGSKAVNYRLRTAPFASQMDADNLCEKLESKGIQCLVIKQNNHLWRTA
jgi:cell division protein FtsN